MLRYNFSLSKYLPDPFFADINQEVSYRVNVLFKSLLIISCDFPPFPLMQMLRSFNVKMLVLSAIPELVSTWVSGFGFKPIQDVERKQVHNVNLMLFPGTSLLTKRFDGFIMATKPG